MRFSRLLAASVLAAFVLGLGPGLPSGEAVAKGRAKSSRAKSAKSTRSAKPSKKSQRSKVSSKRGAKRTRGQAQVARGGKMSKRERLAAVRAARAAAAARRRAELARLAAIRRADESMREAAASSIAHDDLKGEDRVARSAALDALGKRAGTVVVMDPNTGRVLSIVNQRMAVSSTVKPCSTIKPIVALAAMSEKLMGEKDAEKLESCDCEYDDLDDALAYSHNAYFQKLGRELGLSRLVKYAKSYGFGEPTGINLPNESGGELPDEDDIRAGGLGRVASHGDGIKITPIQLAAFTAAVANGGSLYQPQVVAPGKPFTPVLTRQLKIEPKYRRALLGGMTGAVNYGTAKKARDPFDQVAGKTGSCIEYGSWTGLFASFSSVAHPNLVVVVVTRGSGARGGRSADVAGQIYHKLSTRYGSVANRPRRVAGSNGVDGASTMINQ